MRPLLSRHPNLSMIYVADTAHVPYSKKSPEELESIVRRMLQFFLNEKVDLVLFACNTSSALVLPKIRAGYPLPVYGVVEPGIREALQKTKGKGIGMLANEVTAKSGVFKRLIHAKNPDIPVIEQGSTELVTLVEAGDVESSRALDAVVRNSAPFQGKIDTLILACTHFPFLQPHFVKALPGVEIIDPAFSVSDEIATHLTGRTSQAAPVRRLFATKSSPHVTAWAERVLNWKANLEILNLDKIEPWGISLKKEF